MSYFYGPVPSRRLGFSLGIDLVPGKSCPFDCIYCQLGRTTKRTLRRSSRINMKKFKKELKGIIKKNPLIDYITLSGSGEPTLHKNLDKIIAAIKKTTANKYPVCAITNSSLLHKRGVRKELRNADLIIPSLDAVTPHIFKKINRPHKSLTADKIIKGLINLRKEFKGKIWLEIMLVAGVNDSIEEARKLKKAVLRINPDKVQLNLPVRPAGAKIHLPNRKKVSMIKKIINKNAEIISSSYKKKQRNFDRDAEGKILTFLKRRPATLRDLAESLGYSPLALLKELAILSNNGKIKDKIHGGKKFFLPHK